MNKPWPYKWFGGMGHTYFVIAIFIVFAVWPGSVVSAVSFTSYTVFLTAWLASLRIYINDLDKARHAAQITSCPALTFAWNDLTYNGAVGFAVIALLGNSAHFSRTLEFMRNLVS